MRVDSRVFAAALSLFCAGALSYSVARAQSAPAPAPAAHAPKLTEEQFKNIKVLKGLPADQLIPAMQFITASLGVECDYCHVEHAFEKDDKKPKRIARDMITMMMAINKDNFEGHREVTCYSCHRGSTDPVGTPLVATEEAMAAPRPMRGPEAGKPDEAKPALPAADVLFEKYLAAVGGAAALQKITSRTEKGAISFNGHDMPIDVFAQAPDKRVSVMHVPNGESVTAYNGTVGWQTIPSNPPRVRTNTDAENAAARIDADFYFPINVKSLYANYRVATGEKIDGHDTYLVFGRAEGKPPMRLYFDTQSGLLLRLVRYAETPLGRLPTQVDYADYRETGGVKIPYQWTLARPGNAFTIKISDVQQNVAIDAAKFVPPPPPAETAH
ncbi:MAG TPA: c-type cytochrome [Candidatus Acidoferrales bacterium]|nr:c-type cytochrome [Candidatus Acidoferrales bacterium]